MKTVWRLPSTAILACIIASFFVAGFAVYGQSLRNEFVSWDDTFLIVDNDNVKDLSPRTVKNVFTTYDPELYIPLTFLTYQLEHTIGGGAPFVTHIFNRILHILNSLLVAWFLALLLRRGWLALGLGAIFLLHPLNTEAAVWASSRKDLLSTFFFLSSLLTWLHFREYRKPRTYALALILFILGALSKVMVISLPVVMVMIDMLEGKKIHRESLITKIPFFLVSVIFGIVGLFGKTLILASSTTLQKILMACKATVFYIFKFIFPYDLSVIYPYTKFIKFSSPDFFLPFVLTMLLLVLALRLWKYSRLTSFGIFFFFLTLIPTFTNFSKGGDTYFASDRYAYIPMIGLLIMVGVPVRKWMDMPASVHIRKSRRNALLCSSGFIFVVFGYLAHAQAATWQNGTVLYSHVLALYPNARAAHNNLGMEEFIRGEYAAAITQFDAAEKIKLDPKTQANRAAALVAEGKLDEALDEFSKSLSLDPNLPDALYGIGNVYQKKGKLLAAAEQYQKTLDIAPDYTNALNNLGAVYIQLQDWPHAIETLQIAIARKPDFAESYYNLAGAYEATGRKEEAKDMYRKALALRPADADALARLATLVYDAGGIDEAAQLLQQSLSQDSSNPTAIALVMKMKRDGVAK